MLRILIFLLSVCVAHAATINGRVVGVHDGDTLTILTPSKESVKVRLHGIDAPETKQAFGLRAKQELSAMVFGKTVRIEGTGKDRYGRTIGRVFAGNTPVNVEMVRRGFAWWYRAYSKNDRELANAEAEARNGRRGLWADNRVVPPWEFRKGRTKQPVAATAGSQ